MNPQIIQALTLARPLLLESKAELVASSCLLDALLRPRLETLDPELLPTIQQYDAALAAIDTALYLMGNKHDRTV